MGYFATVLAMLRTERAVAPLCGRLVALTFVQGWERMVGFE